MTEFIKSGKDSQTSHMTFHASQSKQIRQLSLPYSLISRRWILSTILVSAAILVTVRLGIWQFDRLDQRREFNSNVEEQINSTTLDLNTQYGYETLSEMEFRKVHVSGYYDHSKEFALRNQYWGNQWGVHLLTPLKISGREETVLVDRGWIPAEEFQSGDWSKFSEPGLLEINGLIRSSRSKADFGSQKDSPTSNNSESQNSWNFVNIQRIAEEADLQLLPIYIQQTPDSTWSNLPYRTQPDLELSEGPHFGYAIQWFTFAALLLIGFPFYVQHHNQHRYR